MRRLSGFFLLLLGMLGGYFHLAQAEPVSAVVPRTEQQVKLSYAPLVKRAAPAVVNIYTKRVVQQRVVSPFFNDPFFQRFFGQQGLGGPVRQRLENSLGSGVMVQRDGLIVSNAHVIKGAQEVTVVLADGREFAADIRLVDERTDLAVLQIDTEGKDLPYLRLGDSDTLEVGDMVLAIGNPFGVGQTVTSGIVSGIARTNVGITDYNFFIQTDAAINPGNSGGALVDMDGRLVGINTAIFSRDGGSLGINFAIPSKMVEAVLLAAVTGNKVVRPWFGASVQQVTSDIAESLGMESPHGALIADLHPKSPAYDAGIRSGDVVLSIDGKAVQDPQALKFRFATLSIGETAELEVFRSGKTRTVKVKAVAPPDSPPRNETAIIGTSPLSGATVANVNPALIEEIGLSGVDSGVVIVGTARPSRAAMLGLRKGDKILQINDAKIASVKDVQAAIKDERRSWQLVIQRGGQILNMMFSG